MRTIAARFKRCAWRAAETILAALALWSWAKFRTIAARLEGRTWRAAERPFAAILPRSGSPIELPVSGPVAFLRRNARFFGQQLFDPGTARLHLALGGQPQRVHLIFAKLAHVSRLHIEHQRPVAHTANLFGKVSDGRKHLPQFAVTSLGQHHLKPGIVALAELADARRGCAHPRRTWFAFFNRHAAAQALEFFRARLPGDLHEVCLLHARAGFAEQIGQFAVVGHQQQAFTQVIEPAHRVHALLRFGEKLHHRGPVFGIAHRGDVAPRLVEHKVAMPLGALKQLAIDANVIAPQIGLAAQLRHDLAIHYHASGDNHLLGVTSAGNARLGENFLQPLRICGWTRLPLRPGFLFFWSGFGVFCVRSLGSRTHSRSRFESLSLHTRNFGFGVRQFLSVAQVLMGLTAGHVANGIEHRLVNAGRGFLLYFRSACFALRGGRFG